MAKPILMPQIGENIKTGTIIQWLVKEGDSFNKGDVIVVVESEKATFEVEAYESGVIQEVLYSNGDEAEVLKPIAYFAQPGEDSGTRGKRHRDTGTRGRGDAPCRLLSPSPRPPVPKSPPPNLHRHRRADLHMNMG